MTSAAGRLGSVVVVGYGREGRSVHRFLLSAGLATEVAIADRHPIGPVAPTTRLHQGPAYLEHLSEYDTIVRSPGVPTGLPELKAARAAGKCVTSATNLFFEHSPGRIVGVTGTKGKSTTSSLTARVIAGSQDDVRLVGNIGRPALDHLEGATEDTVFVMELSSQQLDDAVHSPTVAVVLAVVPEHLDFHGDFEAYLDAKSNIARSQTAGDHIVFNPGHPTAASIAGLSSATQVRFSPSEQPSLDCHLREGKIVVRYRAGGMSEIMPTSAVPLLGAGNLENVMAGVSVGSIFDVPPAAIRAAVESFTALPHRLEFVGERQGIRFYNDSLATIPQAVVHAMEALGGAVATLIAGGHDRGVSYDELARYLSNSSLRSLILFEPVGERLWKALEATHPRGERLRRYDVTSMADAVRVAFEVTPEGGICLLSPGAASFGSFRDYEDRGNQFKALVASHGDGAAAG
jgi:UDP-N-acetylmuramoylalanine--D-glutamate ligase